MRALQVTRHNQLFKKTAPYWLWDAQECELWGLTNWQPGMCKKKKEFGKVAKVKRQQDTWYNWGAFSSDGIYGVTMIIIFSTFSLIYLVHNIDLLSHILKIFEWFIICTTTAGHMVPMGSSSVRTSTFDILDPSDFSSVPFGFFFQISDL